MAFKLYSVVSSSCVASRYTRYAGTLCNILDLLIMKDLKVGLSHSFHLENERIRVI
jgi:hypothetical protein